MALRAKTHQHHATVTWARREGEAFTDGRFSRAHAWAFDGGVAVPASASPSVVRAPYSRSDAVDPEEALVASAAACHMMTFLWLAAKEGFVVDSWQDEAVGEMTANAAGRMWVSRIVLRPEIAFSGERRPTAEDIARLHERAHEECYIANSIRSEVVVDK
jgi:organic hydroperoxide reductase OsmC/OhrA